MQCRSVLVAGVLTVAPWVTCTKTAALEPAASAPLHSIRQSEFCVTNGVLKTLPNGMLAIDSASSRAVMFQSIAQAAEIRFRYLGPSVESKPLASGEMRRQIGIKLRASDTCNLLYVMWHIEPDDKIAVSVKSNPGKHSHAECHAGGYTNVAPSFKAPIPPVHPGESHTLRAVLQAGNVSVIADGRPVWAGPVGDRIDRIDGPIGFRTDNARFEFEYFAADPGPGSAGRSANQSFYHCDVGPGD